VKVKWITFCVNVIVWEGWDRLAALRLEEPLDQIIDEKARTSSIQSSGWMTAGDTKVRICTLEERTQAQALRIASLESLVGRADPLLAERLQRNEEALAGLRDCVDRLLGESAGATGLRRLRRSLWFAGIGARARKRFLWFPWRARSRK
jgi:hypothetical protein